MSNNSGSQPSIIHSSYPLRICRNSATPEEWTLVNDYNIEKKDSYQEWVHTVNSRLYTLKQQLLSYFTLVQQLDEEIIEEHKKLSLLKTTPRSSNLPTPSTAGTAGTNTASNTCNTQN